MIGASLLALVGAFVYWLVWIPWRVPFVVVTLTQYAAPVPPNSWAEEDSQHFVDLDGSRPMADGGFLTDYGGTTVSRLQKWFDPAEAIASLRYELKQRRPGGPRRNVVILYLSAHGILNDQGEPALLLETPTRAPGDDLAQLRQLPLLGAQELLTAVAESYRPDVYKLVIFDSAKFDGCWPLGVARNGFADRLRSLITRMQLSRWYVMTSAAAGQEGKGHYELQGSPFGRYMQTAFTGAADKNDDSRLSMKELFNYVSAGVKDWTARYRNELQEPQMFPELGPGQDFDLAWMRAGRGAGALDDPLKITSEAEPDRRLISELWNLHDQLNPWPIEGRAPSASAIARHDLASFEAFQQGLLRLERLIEAGSVYSIEAGNLSKELQTLADRLKESSRSAKLESYALGTRWRSIWSRQESQPALQAMAEQRVTQPPPPQPEPPPATLVERELAAWQWALKRGEFDNLAKLLTFIEPPADPRIEPVELRWLRLLGPAQILSSVARSDNELLRAALRCRDESQAAAAAHADERAWHSLRAELTRLDERRRGAEDRLILGSGGQLSETFNKLLEVEGLYKQSIARNEKVVEALSVRDRSWARLPYLAQWLDSAATIQPSDPIHRQRCDSWRRLAQETRQLDAALLRYQEACLSAGEDVVAMPQELIDLVAAALRDLDYLQSQVRQEVNELSRNPKDRPTLRRLVNVLAVPLASGKTRIDLYAQLAEITRTRPVVTGSQGDNVKPIERASLPTCWSWPQQPHPIEVLVETTEAPDRGQIVESTPPSEVAKLLGQLGGRWRLKLVDLCQQCRSAVPPESTDVSAESLRRELNVRGKADGLARSVIPLLPLSPISGQSERLVGDAIGRRRAFELHHYLLGLMDRALQDFWGPIGGAAGEEAYFAQFAKELHRAAVELGGDSIFARGRAERLRQLRTSAATAFQPSAQPGYPEGAELTVTTAATVVQAPQIPTGVATLLVERSDQRPVLMRDPLTKAPYSERLPLPVPDPENVLKPGLQLQLGNNFAGGELKLVTFYRAHRFERPFVVRNAVDGQSIEYTPPVYDPPQIEVSGEAGDAGAIVFVFDCSGSMRAVADRGITRMEFARSALNNLLGRLSEVERYRISVWLYGARYGFEEPTPGKFVAVWNDRWGQRLQSIFPSDDVLHVWPEGLSLQQLDRKNWPSLNVIISDQQKVAPLGTTPLYLSMLRAVREDLSKADPEQPRRLIVITDGENNILDTTHPTRKVEANAKQESLQQRDDIIKAFREINGNDRTRRIQLDVVGCALGATAEPDLKFLLDHSDVKGTYVAVDNLQDLNESLLRLISRYRIVPHDATAAPPQEKIFNQVADLPNPDGQRQGYWVNIVNSPASMRVPVYVEGGEFLQLYLRGSGAGARLVHRRFDHDGQVETELGGVVNPKAPTIVAEQDLSPAEVHFSIGQTRREGRGRVFPISIQNDDPNKFSPRPREAWIRIQPRSSAQPQKTFSTYVWYDLEYEPRRGVPVLSVRCPNWPSECDSAAVHVACKFSRTAPTKLLSLRELEINGNKSDPRMDLELPSARPVEKVSFSVQVKATDDGDGTIVTVYQLHEGKTRDLSGVRVELSQPADIVRRVYFEDAGQVQHRFEFRRQNDTKVREYRLQVTPREVFEQDAARTPADKPLIVSF